MQAEQEVRRGGYSRQLGDNNNTLAFGNKIKGLLA